MSPVYVSLTLCLFWSARVDQWNAAVTDIDKAIYYLHRACDYAASAKACKGGSYPLAPPAGLRIVAGDPRIQ